MDEQHTNPLNSANPDPFHKPREEDDYRAASQATADEEAYDEYTKQGKAYTAPAPKGKKVLVTLLIILVIAALVFGAYWLFLRKDTTGTAKKPTNTSENSKASTNNNAESLISSETDHHTSAQFMLEFDYPKDWTISDEAGSGKLTATSPAMMLKDAKGKSFNGQVVFTIRNKQQALPEFDKGNAVAAKESLKINYTKPSQVQRVATYISFLRYASSTSSNGIDGVYVTGDVGYQKDQAIPKADFTPVDPVISITFNKCADSNCSGEGTSAEISDAQWDQASFGKSLQSLLQSLIIN